MLNSAKGSPSTSSFSVGKFKVTTGTTYGSLVWTGSPEEDLDVTISRKWGSWGCGCEDEEEPLPVRWVVATLCCWTYFCSWVCWANCCEDDII